MSPDKSLQNLFNAALERSDAAERARFLDEACGGDAALRERVENLLRAQEEIGAFMAQPSRKPASLDINQTGRVVIPLTEKAGDLIGRYKLLQQIGEGGCGVVYMAEQEEPVRRRVALKVIKLGMDTKQVIARFEAERQALALMDHPNIAKIFDAGITDAPTQASERDRSPVAARSIAERATVDSEGPSAIVAAATGDRSRSVLSAGRPYFVMELVRGSKITDFCDENTLSTEDRLKLFMLVCQAIQHAHQKGIIHRDIKPSNILVTINDGVPVPKVIDFGIAKATAGRLTDQTLFTAFEQFIGTPAYMSPEQAVLTSLDIDTRSDIYSLGVLLYELLTGSPPFDQKELLAAGLDEMRRIIRETEPPRPSNRLSTMAAAALTTTAHHRHTEPPKLIPLLRGDLDWIVMKCLEKDRARRYETANGLATDIARHLKNEPVVARPPGNLYRFQKLVRRNKLAFAAGTAMLMTMLAGTAVSSWQAVRARHAKTETENALKDSEEARLQAQAVSKYLVQAFRSPDPNQDGREIKVVDVLDRAAADLDTNFVGSLKIKGELLDALGQTYTGLGLTAKALEVLDEARAVDRAVLGPDHPDTLGVNIDIVQAYRIDRRLADAVPLLEDTLKRSRSKLGSDHPLTLTTMKDLGDAYRAAGRAADAVLLLEETLKLCKAKLDPDDPTTLYTMNNLAGAYGAAGRPAEAVSMLEETLKLMKAKLGPDHRDTLNTTDNLANAYRASGRASNPVPMLEETLGVCKAKFGPDHPDTLNTMNFLGNAYRQLGRSADAVSMLEETLKLMKVKLGPDNVITLDTMNNLALAYRAAGRASNAVPLLEETLILMKDRLGPDHFTTLNTANNLANAYWAAGRLTNAVPLSEETLKLCNARLDPHHPETLRCLNNLSVMSLILLRQENFTDAERLARECLAFREKQRLNDWQTFDARSVLGATLLGQKKHAEAEPLLLSGYAGLKQREGQIPVNGKIRLQESLQRLMRLYEATGQPEKAAEWNKKLAEFDQAKAEK